jgi:hypothetical protein
VVARVRGGGLRRRGRDNGEEGVGRKTGGRAG